MIDLEDWEYDACLTAADKMLRTNHSWRKAGSRGAMKRSQGPESFYDPDRAQRERYNGHGSYHCWFQWQVFEERRRAAGLGGQDDITERDCVRLLAETSRWINAHPQWKVGLKTFGGPQSYPEWVDAAQDRRSQQFADEAPAAGAVSGGAMVREQFAECWCRCSCGKFRLVERHCMDSLSSDAFCKGQATCRSWSAWLEGAESRYDEFVAEQARATDREAALREFGAPTVDAAFGSDQHAGACAEGVAADARPAEGGADSDGASASSVDGSLVSGDLESEGLADVAVEVRDGLKDAIATFASRSGGPTAEEVAVVGREGGGAEDVSAELGAVHIKPQVLAFRCAMVQGLAAATCEAGVSWSAVSCDDACDFAALQSRPNSLSGFAVGDQVVLLDACASEPPAGQFRFLRLAVVREVRAPSVHVMRLRQRGRARGHREFEGLVLDVSRWDVQFRSAKGDKSVLGAVGAQVIGEAWGRKSALRMQR